MTKIKTICTYRETPNSQICGAGIIQDKQRSMKRCPRCGNKWFFKINIDGTVGLFHCRSKKSYMDKAIPMSTSFSRREAERAKEAGYGITALTRIGYQVAVLGIDFSR